MKVKDCMCKNVAYLTPDATIQDCAKLMSSEHIGCIPVCDTNKKIVGIVTDRDVILRSIAWDKDVKTTPLSDIMTTDVYYCNENDEVNYAQSTMSTEQIRRLPVLNEQDQIVGIITLGNLCANQYVETNGIGETLEDICNSNRKNAE